jgi:holin (3TMs family)
MIADAISGFFSGVVKPVLDKFVPDAKERLEAEQSIMKGLIALDTAQIEVNKVEAAHSNWLVAGWRPAMGWVGVISIWYSVMGYTAINWVLSVAMLFTAGQVIPMLPVPDTSVTFDIVMGMLGLAGVRTYEKIKGIAKE